MYWRVLVCGGLWLRVEGGLPGLAQGLSHDHLVPRTHAELEAAWSLKDEDDGGAHPKAAQPLPLAHLHTAMPPIAAKLLLCELAHLVVPDLVGAQRLQGRG